jgi:hypothetical protein
MSSHPYGLRGDPFVPPATLNAKDASRLIRRRVRAFNGDGGTLFPIATCDLIHELAGGVPDAMLALAGQAMRIAAAEAAPAVAPAHVRRASEAARAVAAPTTSPVSADAAPPVRGVTRAARAARALDELLEDEGKAPNAPATPPARSGEAAEQDEADAPVPVATEVEDEVEDQEEAVGSAAADAELGTAAAAGEDEDLPPFRPASIALPSAPSENLDQDAREWVSRFIPAAGAPPPPREPVRAGRSRRTRKVTRSLPAEAAGQTAEPTPEARPEPLAEAVPALLHAAPKPRRASRSRGGWGRRRSNGGSLLFALAVVVIVAVVVRQSVRQDLVSPASGPDRAAPTSARIVEPPASRPEPAPAVPAPAVTAPTAAPEERSAAALGEPRRLHQATDPATSGSATPSADGAARRERPSGRYGLEVATFIFEDRARMERDRLVASGLRARLVTTVEYGSRVYRVVLGGYPHPAAAERAADSLLSNGVVLQARVVTVPPRR